MVRCLGRGLGPGACLGACPRPLARLTSAGTQSWFGFTPQLLLTLKLTNIEGRRTKLFDTGASESLRCLVYNDGEDVEGSCEVHPSARYEHNGIKAELKGVLEQFHDRSHPKEFTAATQVLCGPGSLSEATTFFFSFKGVRLPHETYYGVNARVRYMVRVTVEPKSASLSTVDKSVEFAVERYEPRPTADAKIRMEVGIEDFLHIEFEYDRSHYDLKDVLTGRVYFRLVQLQLKHMELAISRREKTKTHGVTYSETDTLCKYEVMDGVPARGTVVPLRLFLEAYELTPTYRKVEGIFSVEYFVNLVLIDKDDRRYFKQHEISLFREDPDERVKVVTRALMPARSSALHTLKPSDSHAASAAPPSASPPLEDKEDVPASPTRGGFRPAKVSNATDMVEDDNEPGYDDD
jgi:vacuolar protein sorting-associated protein 26